MGLCYGNPIQKPEIEKENPPGPPSPPAESASAKPFRFPFYMPIPLRRWCKNWPANSRVSSTPLRTFKGQFHLPSPATHIRILVARRNGSVKPNEALNPRGSEVGTRGLDKNFGFSKQFKYELGEEVGRGHFGYTCLGIAKKGEMKWEEVAVKVIPKAKMTTAIAIKDVRREVRILSSLSGHKNLVQLYNMLMRMMTMCT